MNKKLLIVPILLFLLLCINVKAKTFLPDEVDPNTYIVGTHMFTGEGSDIYDGTFTTEWIMYASRSIESDNYEDMIIYRRQARGNWVNAISGAAITPPNEGFEIEFIDEVNIISLDDPLTIEVSGEPAPLTKIIGYNLDDFCALGDENGCIEYAIDGIEIYKVLGNDQYELLDLPREGDGGDPEAERDYLSFPVFDIKGVQMTIIARVYKEIGGRKEYSEYSNTLDIDTIIPTPSLGEGGSTFLQKEFGPSGYGDNGFYCTDDCEAGAFQISGYEVYKKNGDSYEKIGEKTELAPYITTMVPNTQETYAIRVFIEAGDSDDRFYSDYATIDFDTAIPAPLIGEAASTFLQKEFGPRGYGENNYYCINDCEDDDFEISGYEVYKKNGNNYEKIGEKAELSPYSVTMLPNTQETYAIRVFIEAGDPVQRYYSDYDEIDFDTTIPVPAVSPSVGQPGANPVYCEGEVCSVDIGSGLLDNIDYPDAYEYADLFEDVEDGEDVLVTFADEAGYTGIPTGGARMIAGVPKGTVKKYYARAYIMVNGQKYYSDPTTPSFTVTYTND